MKKLLFLFVLILLVCSCKTYNVYLLEQPAKEIIRHDTIYLNCSLKTHTQAGYKIELEKVFKQADEEIRPLVLKMRKEQREDSIKIFNIINNVKVYDNIIEDILKRQYYSDKRASN